MECGCYTFGEAALQLNPCPVHERWAKAIRAVAVHDERERCVGVALEHGWDEALGEDAAHNIADALRVVT